MKININDTLFFEGAVTTDESIETAKFVEYSSANIHSLQFIIDNKYQVQSPEFRFCTINTQTVNIVIFNYILKITMLMLILYMIFRQKQQKLERLLRNFPAVGIIGPRQAGKTTLARQYVNILEDNDRVIYLDLENPRDFAKLGDPVLFFENNMEKLVILDEIQRMPSLFPVLRSMIDQKRSNGRFLLLGSASPELIRESSESLAGRIAYLELTPFNLKEIENTTTLSTHWFRGGYPMSLLAVDDADASEWLLHFIRTYTEQDLPAIGLPADPLVTRKLMGMMAHIHGNLLNMSNLGRALELTSTTINSYLSYLESAFLLRLLQPYHMNIKKRLVKAPKVYIRDSGMLHSLLNIEKTSDLFNSPMVGNSWEGYALEQIISQLDERTTAYFYRTQVGAECDLVLVRGGKPTIAVEIKYTASPRTTRGLTQSLEDLNTKKNFIITPDTDDYLLKENLRVCSLRDFLNNYLL